jgi:hypothetical protein
MKPCLVALATEPVFAQSQSPNPTPRVQPASETEPVATATGRDATTSHQVMEKTAPQEINPHVRQDAESEASTGPEDAPPEADETKADTKSPSGTAPTARITFALAGKPPFGSKALYIPPPRDRDNGGVASYMNRLDYDTEKCRQGNLLWRRTWQ